MYGLQTAQHAKNESSLLSLILHGVSTTGREDGEAAKCSGNSSVWVI